MKQVDLGSNSKHALSCGRGHGLKTRQRDPLRDMSTQLLEAVPSLEQLADRVAMAQPPSDSSGEAWLRDIIESASAS